MKDRPTHDRSLDVLLDLDGAVMVLDEAAEYWVKFEVRRVLVSGEQPHGLEYCLTLHGKNNQRLVGFDNAHPIRKRLGPGGKAATFDHKHRLKSIRPYEYRDAASLLSDFWAALDAILRERGILE